MTGFGAAEGESDGIHYAVEIRSLNNRYFKCQHRLPEEIAGLEPEVEGVLRSRIQRGSLTLIVRLKRLVTPPHKVNDSALLAYMEHLEMLRDRVGDHAANTSIDLTALLALPGVLQPDGNGSDPLERARPIILQLVSDACDRLVQMRDNEGREIGQELLDYQGQIGEILSRVAERTPTVVEAYQQRLTQRIQDLLARADRESNPPDLIKEVALFAERVDISEETSRLRVHLDHLASLVRDAQSQPAGRTLDFLAQELLREANTIASKSNDAEISRAIVETKGIIDRIKEQVQNVE